MKNIKVNHDAAQAAALRVQAAGAAAASELGRSYQELYALMNETGGLYAEELLACLRKEEELGLALAQAFRSVAGLIAEADRELERLDQENAGSSVTGP